MRLHGDFQICQRDGNDAKMTKQNLINVERVL